LAILVPLDLQCCLELERKEPFKELGKLIMELVQLHGEDKVNASVSRPFMFRLLDTVSTIKAASSIVAAFVALTIVVIGSAVF
jgi:hypothetical protein